MVRKIITIRVTKRQFSAFVRTECGNLRNRASAHEIVGNYRQREHDRWLQLRGISAPVLVC